MSRLARTPNVDHQHAAGQARQMPGQWVLAGTYRSSLSAKSVARAIRAGNRMPYYRPVGAFEARPELTEDGADLWVRYVDDQARRDFRESIASGLTEDFTAFSRRLEEAVTDTTRRA